MSNEDLRAAAVAAKYGHSADLARFWRHEPDRILALCDRVDELEPVAEAAFEFVDARAEWMAGDIPAARMVAAELKLNGARAALREPKEEPTCHLCGGTVGQMGRDHIERNNREVPHAD